MSNEKKTLKLDEGKAPLSLVPEIAIEAEARAFAHGATKPGRERWGWLKLAKKDPTAFRITEIVDALQRHAARYAAGEDIDPESGQPHLAHIRCNTSMLLTVQKLGLCVDDRERQFLAPVLGKESIPLPVSPDAVKR